MASNIADTRLEGASWSIAVTAAPTKQVLCNLDLALRSEIDKGKVSHQSVELSVAELKELEQKLREALSAAERA